MINASVYSQCPDMPVCYRRPLWLPGWRWWGQWCPPRWGTRTGWWSRPPGWSPRRSAPSSGAAHCHWPDLRSLGPGHREWRGPARISTGQNNTVIYLQDREQYGYISEAREARISTGQRTIRSYIYRTKNNTVIYQRRGRVRYTSIYWTEWEVVIFLRETEARSD